MAAYVIFDVEIRDMAQYQQFMLGVKPALEAAGARYLARGGAYQGLKAIRDQCSSARLVSVEGLA